MIKKRSSFVFIFDLAIERSFFLSFSPDPMKKERTFLLFRHGLQLILDRLPLAQLTRRAPMGFARLIFIVVRIQSGKCKKFLLNWPLSTLWSDHRWGRDRLRNRGRYTCRRRDMRLIEIKFIGRTIRDRVRHEAVRNLTRFRNRFAVVIRTVIIGMNVEIRAQAD